MLKRILGFILILSMLLTSYQVASAAPNSFIGKITKNHSLNLAKANSCNSSKTLLLLTNSVKACVLDSKNINNDDGLLALSNKLNFNLDNNKFKHYNLFLAYSSPLSSIYQPPRLSHYTLI